MLRSPPLPCDRDPSRPSGLAAQLSAGCPSLEGDCRYVAAELLQGRGEALARPQPARLQRPAAARCRRDAR